MKKSDLFFSAGFLIFLLIILCVVTRNVIGVGLIIPFLIAIAGYGVHVEMEEK